MIDTLAFVAFVGMIFYVMYMSVVKDDLALPKRDKFKPAPPAHNQAAGPRKNDSPS